MNLSFDFTGRTALVTGASAGVGFEICWMFAEAGARVVPVDVDARSLKSAWGSTSEFVLPIAANVADPKCAEEVVAACIEWGGLDIVVDIAEMTSNAKDWEADGGDWNKVYATQMDSARTLTRAALLPMRGLGTGRIVVVSSYAGIREDAAAASALIEHTMSVAKEVAGFGITVNAVSAIADAGDDVSELATSAPRGHFAKPSEISYAVAFLSSDEASSITGVLLPIYGGLPT